MLRRAWIFDTVVLSNFLLSNGEFLVKGRYKGNALISGEVYTELAAGFVSYPRLQQVDNLIDDGTLQLTSLSRKELEIYRQLTGHLGRGEASSVAIAYNRKATMVTDDRAARSQCAQMKITVTGTIGILKASVMDDLISLEQADALLQKMIKKGFYSPVRGMKDIILDYALQSKNKK